MSKNAKRAILKLAVTPALFINFRPNLGGTHPIGTIKKCFIITKKLATETIMLLARIWEQCILAAKE